MRPATATGIGYGLDRLVRVDRQFRQRRRKLRSRVDRRILNPYDAWAWPLAGALAERVFELLSGTPDCSGR